MKQECVFFHTEKGIEDAEQIFEKNNMKVVFKSDRCSIDFAELTDEEKISFLKKDSQQIKESIDNTQEMLSNISDDLKKIQKIYKDYEIAENDNWNLKSLQRYETQSRRLEQRLSRLGRYRSSFFVSRFLHLGMNRDGRIDCGVIIGNIDGNLVRYLEFHDNDDPVVTITGSGATSIKSQLESQF
ncbi:hypothetical protein SCCGRSA3_02035 [Marine Group I thaumarchaeote SCGC RSA3]|uniref:Uncharacterized protein n=2 Tax=Marine Group I TaxID=905826 RepID=A0A081RMX3_9ARCH|nr:hypothetical protein AAA799N04_01038 [Marine Group I thaumarchaeote SCGC AAA799-N04]KFM16832.1 hypothetical protein SCCGRSA3_02035 [Marine Group I thaumarchaeote SCGC RSA3]